MKVFFDTEFTGLHQNTSLISIGMIDEDRRKFYGIFNDYKKDQVDDWIKENVIKNLHNTKPDIVGDTETVKKEIELWLARYDHVEMWSDCLSYDWVLFNNLFGSALNIPKNIFYIPFDICTLFKIMEIDPDINREEFVGIKNKKLKHNAMFDASLIKRCYEKLIRLEFVQKLRDIKMD